MKFYGQWNPPEDEVAYRNYFQNGPEDGFFIECGAGNYGSACRFFEETLGWKGLNLEASPRMFKNLNESRTSKKSLNLHCGLSNRSGTAIFTDIIRAPGGGGGNGSFSHHPKHKKILDGYGCTYEDIEVEIWRYRDLFDDLYYLGHIPYVTYLSLDVEGHELQVIEGMAGSVVLPDVICVEYTVSGLDNIRIALENLGYTYNFVSFNNAFFSHIQKDSWWGATDKLEEL